MTTKTIHSYFDQEMEITHNHDVILRLHDPHDSNVKLPVVQCDLSQFLNGLAFMQQGELSAPEFMRYFQEPRRKL